MGSLRSANRSESEKVDLAFRQSRQLLVGEPELVSLVVTTLVDVIDVADGFTSLREAIMYAISNPGNSTITFDPSLAGETITLSQAWTIGGGSALEIPANSAITIQGLTEGDGVTLAVDSDADLRHFLVHGNAALTLNHLTLTGGRATRDGAPYGGAVWSFGSLTVSNSTFTDNLAAEGGAIQSWGGGGSPLLRVENSTFVGNTSNGFGGSALSIDAVNASLDHVTIIDNNTTGLVGSLRIKSFRRESVHRRPLIAGLNEILIDRIAIAGYRSIRSIILRLGQLNVVTGANGGASHRGQARVSGFDNAKTKKTKPEPDPTRSVLPTVRSVKELQTEFVAGDLSSTVFSCLASGGAEPMLTCYS